MPTTFTRGLALAVPGAFVLGACGGGGGDAERPAPPAAALAVPAVEAGPPASEVSTGTLTRNAARHAGDGLVVNLAAADAVAGELDADAAGTALAAVGVGPELVAALDDGAGPAGAGELVAGLLDGPFGGPLGGPGAPGGAAPFDDAASDEGPDGYGASFASFVAHSLGERGTANMRRDGDRVEIDPDEFALCAAFHGRWYRSETDRANCRALGAELGVVVEAVAESAGIVTWSFRDEPVLRAAYAPDRADYELRLSGLGTYLRAAAALAGAPTSGRGAVPPTLEGTLRLAAEVRSREPGAEAGSVSFGVGETLRVADPTLGTRLELEPSTLFALAADAATGDGSMGMTLGAFAASIGVDLGNGETTSFAFSHGGAVMDAVRDGASGELELARYGLPGAPLAWSIDGRDVARASMPVTGARIGRGGDSMVLTGRANPTLELLGDPETGEGLAFAIDVPAGTRLVERASGDLEVREGGPLVATLEAVRADGGVERSEASVAAGECIDRDAPPMANRLFATRPCD